MIVIIDYGMGNIRSVKRKFVQCGANPLVSNNYSDVRDASKIVLPGVGHFAMGVQKIKEYGLWDILQEHANRQDTPILGICLGMQLMAKTSEEGGVEGLAWFDAEIVKFAINDHVRYKIPHIGWNNISQIKQTRLLSGIPQEAMFYFVHGYHIKCNNKEDILTTSTYESTFASSIQKDNIYGVQFHPEKSHEIGESLIKNFINL
jgi:imidazole glycerol-phosphate synthase subunit HisH